MPFDAAYWSEEFPELIDLFARVGDAVHHVHGCVKVKGWQRGRIAIVGDAAHGQPPNLGQGAGMAIRNAQALAYELDQGSDIEASLENWERRNMKLTVQVQNWSMGWGHVMHEWPLALLPLRSALVVALNKLPTTRRYWKSLYRGVAQHE